MIDRFAAFVLERQAVWHRRFVQGLPRPWTTDPVLHEWRFTNIQRELDAGTLYLTGLLKEHAASWCTSDVFRVLLYRWLNNRESWAEATAEDGGWPRSRDTFWTALKARRKCGKPVFTSAWVVNTYNSDKPKGMDSLDYMQIVSKEWRTAVSKILEVGSVQELYRAIRPLPLFGPMITWQATLDLIYLRSDLDDDTWMPPLYDGSKSGTRSEKGSAAGARRVMPNEHPNMVPGLLRKTRDKWLDPDAWAAVTWEGKPQLSLADIEHALCEFDKYERVNEGGKMKRRYK